MTVSADSGNDRHAIDTGDGDDNVLVSDGFGNDKYVVSTGDGDDDVSVTDAPETTSIAWTPAPARTR